MGNENLTLEELQDHFVEAVSEIIRDHMDGDIQESDFYRQAPDNRYNLRLSTDDDGWFLILGGWNEADIISQELLDRYPCLREEAEIDCVNYDNVLSELYFPHYGFSDEYTHCDRCGSPLSYEDGEYIDDYDACERVCFDCVDDSDYFEWLSNDAGRANQKYNRGELEARGWVCVSEDLRSTMHNMPSDNPEQMLQEALEADPDGQYIFSITHADPFTVEFEMYRFES